MRFEIRRHNIQHYDTQHNDTLHNDIKKNGTQHKGLVYDIQLNNPLPFYAECRILFIVMLNVFMLSVIMLSVVAAHKMILLVVNRHIIKGCK